MGFKEYSDSFISKLHLGELGKPAMLGVVAVIIVAVIGSSFVVLDTTSASGFQVEKSSVSESAEENLPVEGKVEKEICVHVGGCVENPGVVYLKEGSRVDDAIQAVGGFAADAAKESINLAREVQDGEQIIVASTMTQNAQTSVSDDAEIAQVPSSNSSNGKVNINTASSSDLQTLSGIGESKAQKIIAYREKNGYFKSVDDLTNVSGIGDKTLESIRSSICV